MFAVTLSSANPEVIILGHLFRGLKETKLLLFQVLLVYLLGNQQWSYFW